MKLLNVLAAVSVVAMSASPVLADRVVHRTVVVKKTVHRGPGVRQRKRVCNYRVDHRGHRIRHCWWG